MHAIVARQAGGPEVLELDKTARPVPGPGQLLVKVAAAGVNFIDTYKRSGVYKVSYPFTPGSEAAGTVEEVGDAVTGFAPGDRVATAFITRHHAPAATVIYEGAPGFEVISSDCLDKMGEAQAPVVVMDRPLASR